MAEMQPGVDTIELRSFQKYVHDVAKKHGWWEGHRTEGDLVMLMVTELAEAYEEVREHGAPADTMYEEDGKPDGFFVELADCIIRILDMAEFYGQDMTAILLEKMRYNEIRPYRHGGKHV